MNGAQKLRDHHLQTTEREAKERRKGNKERSERQENQHDAVPRTRKAASPGWMERSEPAGAQRHRMAETEHLDLAST